jgi:hypothetical protein
MTATPRKASYTSTAPSNTMIEWLQTCDPQDFYETSGFAHGDGRWPRPRQGSRNDLAIVERVEVWY